MTALLFKRHDEEGDTHQRRYVLWSKVGVTLGVEDDNED